jgi:hypothetical protein
MIKAVGAGSTFSDVDEAAGIVYAVDHGAVQQVAGILKATAQGAGGGTLGSATARSTSPPPSPPPGARQSSRAFRPARG